MCLGSWMLLLQVIGVHIKATRRITEDAGICIHPHISEPGAGNVAWRYVSFFNHCT
ncbi:hypothetical protein KSZ_61680 [Dictyobacter formicarum]|uniref:Uncharacterized protein n=1 Tax=Dictyobacter formicarum TaxID=2778368 RepID=A0ABQ3VQM1_9CHLR|nr:hypothetical protein KSZ_61680 [Dictyobacter formicarum]